MVTYRLRRSKLRVRFLAPHPFFIVLAVFLLCGSAGAVDQDYYRASPDSLAASLSSSDSLARALGGDIFGIYWSSFGSGSQITAIDGVDMTGRADGVQELATATYRTFQGVERAIVEASSGSEYLPLIYGTLQQKGDMGTVYTRLLELLDLSRLPSSWFGRDSGVPIYVPNGNSLVKVSRTDIPTILSDLTDWGYAALKSNHQRLDSSGSIVSGNGVSPYFLSDILAEGLVGMSRLLFGPDANEIYGLDYTGQDKTGVRGSWSLADITANGFGGLGYLIGGPSYEGERRHGVWTWIDPTDPTNTREYEPDNLFDLFWEIGWLQNSLAKLEYVYASKEDIEFKEQEKENMDAVKDEFFGDGQGAVKPSDIKDAAGLSSSIKDSFAGAGSSGDAFQAINDSQSFWFFSQEVADALDTVHSPAVAADDPGSVLDSFSQGDDGFYSLIDLSPWDVSKYLGGD